MNNYAVLSGDIVASTSIHEDSKTVLESSINELFEILETRFETFSRMVKGDYIECGVPGAYLGLRVALLFKTHIKSLNLKGKNNRFKYFEEYGIRMVIGYGSLSRYDPQNGVMDGEAIYLSGRKVSEDHTHTKERVVIKNSLEFASDIPAYNEPLEALFSLIDFLIIRATKKQCEVVHYKLLGYSEEQISEKLGTSQSAVNQHSTRVGWNAIEKAVNYYETLIKST